MGLLTRVGRTACSIELIRPSHLRCPTCRVVNRWSPTASLHFQRHVATSAVEGEALSSQKNASEVKLRPYQEDSIRSVLDYLAKGERRLGISLATGSGKTVIFSHLIDRVPNPTPEATQTLIIAHRRELIEQAARHCRNTYPNKTVEVEMGSQRASSTADITVASIQTLMSSDRLVRFDPSRFKLVLVDEAHHIVASSYLDVLKHFKLLDADDRGPTSLVGVSATFSRGDGLRLGTAIDHIVYHKDYIDMIEEEWLSGVVFTTVQSKADFSKVKSTHGDFQISSLSNAVNNENTNTITVQAWLEKAGSRKSTLVFCVDLAHVAAVTATFRLYGIDARFVTSDTPKKVRAQRLDDFKAGVFPVLVNCGIFTEGTDIPNIDCIVLARPTQSRNLLVQMIGRGLRKHPGKENCHVIDLVASLDTGIVTTPTLFGLDPGSILEHADVKEMKTRKEKVEEEKEREEVASSAAMTEAEKTNHHLVFTDYDDVNDLIQDTSGERHIRAISHFAWVQIDENRYILCNRAGDYLTLKKGDDDLFKIMYTRKIPEFSASRFPFARPEEVGQTTTFEAAVNAGDTFAGEVFQFEFILTSALWRKSPATENQITYLNRFREEGDKLERSSATKGVAADWITKMRHGAKGRFGRIVVAKRKAQREEARMEKLQKRRDEWQISVGAVK